MTTLVLPTPPLPLVIGDDRSASRAWLGLCHDRDRLKRRGLAEHGGGQQLRGRAVEIFRHTLPGAEIGNRNLPFVQQADERRQRIRLVELS